jgi:hypothetical protein
MSRSILGISLVVFGGSASTNAQAQFDICAGNEYQFVDMIGGAALGSSITASVAGQSILLIVTEGAALIVSTPAVAPALATSAIVGSSAYVFMKGYCNAEMISDISADLYQAAEDKTVKTVSVVAGTYEIAVNQTSENIETVAEVHKIAVRQQSKNIEEASTLVGKGRIWLAEKFCVWDSKCQ